jgi:putative membrane-bound dehydrogenase-like protein
MTAGFCKSQVMILACFCVASLSVTTELRGQPTISRSQPKEPNDALASFHIRDGFEMQLLAAEPLITDPVAMEYDENGNAYVAEMRDYPFTGRETDQVFAEQTASLPLGQIRLLQDLDEDGVFERSTVFADQLSWPTGIALWKGGVFVVATPDLWYLKDTDADGRADVRQRVLTGFRKFNIQAVINNLKWGIDHRLYGAGSSNGGRIHTSASDAAQALVMATGDFRFRPDQPFESFELLSGGARFGNTFDDRGNRFICNIRNPIQHVVIPRHYTARNPSATFRPAVQDVAASGDSVPVRRRSPPEPWRVLNARRLANDGTLASPRSETVAAGYMTSASGVTIYRGDAYPAEYYGSVFLGEVAGNLIHHERLIPNGVTFRSEPSDANSEFLASTDNWFRPVNFVNAPDGTLHVLDMYRETIEHPWSIPDDIKAQLDLESGRDRGRIYRLAPRGFRLRKPPRLGAETTAALVGYLRDGRSWYRETAHRLIFERRDSDAVEPLRRLLHDRLSSGSATPNVSSRSTASGNTASAEGETAVEGRSPDVHATARLLALWSLEGLQSLTEDDLRRCLHDPDPGVRAQAVLLAESKLQDHSSLIPELLTRATDDDVIVRYQIAMTLGVRLQDESTTGSVPDSLSPASLDAVRALAKIARRDAADVFVQAAVLSSSGQVSVPLISELLRPSGASENSAIATAPPVDSLMHDLAAVVGVRAKEDEINALLDVVAQYVNADSAEAAKPAVLSASENSRPRLFAITSGLGKGLKRSGLALTDVLSMARSPGAELLRSVLEESAQRLAVSPDDPSAVIDDLKHRAELLAYSDFGTAERLLTPWLRSIQSADMQAVAIRVLAGYGDEKLVPTLIDVYRALRPSARNEVVETLLSRAQWHPQLLTAVEHGTIAVFDIPQLRRNLLLRSADSAVKERAVKLFSAALASRRDVVDRYRDALPMLQADHQQGEIVFRRECQTCHRVGTAGQELGPNLATIRNRTPEEVLLHILDPNREVAPNYVAQAILLTDGRSLSGIVTAEDAGTLTVKSTAGSESVISRAEITEINSTGQSLMPVGFEQRITLQEMSSLLEFLLQPSP